MARITGILDRNPTDEEPIYVVVAVEGTIHAVAPAFRGRTGDHLFSTMLPEDAYRFPGDRVELFALDFSNGVPGLLRITTYLGDLKPGRARALGGGPR